MTAQHAGAVVGFRTRRGERVNARVASSFISPEQAELNLREIGEQDFDAVRRQGRAAWNKALSFYPVCPGTDQYVLGAPLFPKATLHLPSGKDIVLNASNNSAQNRYVNQLNFNGQPYDKNWLSHTALMQGATLDFDMSATPNKNRGTQPAAAPYSFSKAK